VTRKIGKCQENFTPNFLQNFLTFPDFSFLTIAKSLRKRKTKKEAKK